MDHAEALQALTARRELNKKRPRIDNSKLPAHSPMHFDCKGCGADIEVEEDYTPPRPAHCSHCTLLVKAGLLN